MRINRKVKSSEDCTQELFSIIEKNVTSKVKSEIKTDETGGKSGLDTVSWKPCEEGMSRRREGSPVANAADRLCKRRSDWK